MNIVLWHPVVGAFWSSWIVLVALGVAGGLVALIIIDAHFHKKKGKRPTRWK